MMTNCSICIAIEFLPSPRPLVEPTPVPEYGIFWDRFTKPFELSERCFYDLALVFSNDFRFISGQDTCPSFGSSAFFADLELVGPLFPLGLSGFIQPPLLAT